MVYFSRIRTEFANGGRRLGAGADPVTAASGILGLFQREWIWNTTWGSQPEPKPSY